MSGSFANEFSNDAQLRVPCNPGQRGQNQKQPQTIEQGMAGCADHIGVLDECRILEAQRAADLARMAIECCALPAIDTVAHRAIPDRRTIAHDLVRKRQRGGLGHRWCVAIDTAHRRPMATGIGQPGMDGVDIRAILLPVRAGDKEAEGFVGVMARKAGPVALFDQTPEPLGRALMTSRGCEIFCNNSVFDQDQGKDSVLRRGTKNDRQIQVCLPLRRAAIAPKLAPLARGPR